MLNINRTTKVSPKKPADILLDIHSMPATSEQSLKTWYILGGVVLFIILLVFLIFVI